MTPEQQAVVDRLMGLAQACEGTFHAVVALGLERKPAHQAAKAALRTAIEELAQQAAEARDDYMRLLREKQARTLAALASQPLVPAGYVLVPKRTTRAIAQAAAEHHYGKRRVAETGIEGIAMTVDGLDFNFWQAWQRMWRGAMLAASPAVQEAPAAEHAADVLGVPAPPSGSVVASLPSIPDAACEDRAPERIPLPYETPMDLWRAFVAGAKFVLHYHGKQFAVTRMEPREHVVYVQPPGMPVKVFPDGRSCEGDSGSIWLAQAPDAREGLEGDKC